MSKVKILIVEDDNLISWEIKDRLENLGYEVPAVFISGDDTLSALELIKPDLILMDIRIEGMMDGIETAQRIRERYEIPIIYLTAHSDKSTLERAKITEPYAYLLKPFHERDLHTSIEMTLYKHKVDTKSREHDHWLSMTMESMKDGIITTNTRGMITFMNTSAEVLTGWKFENVMGKDVWSILQICDEVNVSGHTESDVAEKPDDQSFSSCILLNKDGQEVPILYIISSIIDEKGTHLGTVFTLKDITALKKLESQVQQIHRMEAIGTLAGGIAHDFNNIMTAVQMSVELTLLDLDPSDPLHLNIEEILNLTNHASTLTNQLLLISQKHPSKPITMDLNEKIQNLSTVFSNVLGDSIHIQYDLNPDLEKIQADDGSIEQLFMNLTSNAKDAMSDGGLLLIKTENIIIDEENESTNIKLKQGKYACISIIDNGTGMDEETVAHIFEPFYSKSRLSKGACLRLATVYGIIRQLRGWVDVKSEIGRGTAFHVYFPIIGKINCEQIKTSSNKPLSKDNGKRILVVEDEERVREFIGKALEKNGF